MITDGIMEIIWDMQNRVIDEIEKLELEYNARKISITEYATKRDILDAKMDVLNDVMNEGCGGLYNG